MKPDEKPLSECLLTAFFRPYEYWELPTRHFMEMWPERTLEPVEIGENQAGNALSPEEPVPRYRLVSADDDTAPIILFGVNSISINASGKAYTGWEAYKERALRILGKTNDLFDSQAGLDPLVFRYVDVFRVADFEELGRFFQPMKRDFDYESGLQPIGKLAGTEIEIGGIRSVAIRSYEVFAPLGESPSKLRFLVEYKVQAPLPRPNSEANKAELIRWLDGAHRVHKKMFWDVLTDEYREKSGEGLFDSLERETFGSMKPGLEDLFQEESGQ